MSERYWQAKIWGILHDPGLKTLSHSKDLGREGQWHLLQCMAGWKSPKTNSNLTSVDPDRAESLNTSWLKHVGLCDLIASASDRSTIGRLNPRYSAIAYDESGLQIHHLLSGEPQTLQMSAWHQRLLQTNRRQFLEELEQTALEPIQAWQDPRQVHWWLWRCYHDLLAADAPGVHLLPAETRFPDASLWSHVSITSALAGGLAGYHRQTEAYPKKNERFTRSRPHLVVFSFSPVQELIKASRKMRDFWAGSWLLHYLSAKVCWTLAQKYGADIFLYPSLYQQPLIDHWLLQTYPEFSQWIKQPSTSELLTAGFPNVIVMVLPDNGKDGETRKDNPIYAAVQLAKQTLQQEWQTLGDRALEFLQRANPAWREINPHTWDSWLNAQWQTYWTALPVGNLESELTQSPRKPEEYQNWCDRQNEFTTLKPQAALFETNEAKFLQAVFNLIEESESKQPNINVGSWWGYIFDRLRINLTSVKNARTWQMPTAFGPRSTVSGIGAVVRPICNQQQTDWATEGQTRQFWSHPRNGGLFDGIEELNATEVVKRVVHQILPDLLGIKDLSLTYPDLSSGVAGWLKGANPETLQYYQTSCDRITQQHQWTKAAAQTAWGIPWIDSQERFLPHPRLLNYGWIVEDYQADSQTELTQLRQTIDRAFPPGSNPTDWYVLAAGDGDGMSEWLKGTKLNSYQSYIPQALQEKIDKFPPEIKQPVQEFLKVNKRMGPATHSALSRSLLDFANQLVPYLTESRYAGRLIYCGGDDILAYTNLWEWDSWLWDIRQCFRGDADPQDEFISQGDYWHRQDTTSLPHRPLFTLGSKATVSFGIMIAHHSVPLAIALEHLWQAEAEAKAHYYMSDNPNTYKDAVQVRVVYGNGNVLKATAKFSVFTCWQKLVNFAQSHRELDCAIFEQAAQIWSQHPAPRQAIIDWTKAFGDRRQVLAQNQSDQQQFINLLGDFISKTFVYNATNKQRDQEIQTWLKLAAFMVRNRQINIGQNAGKLNNFLANNI